MKTFFGLWILLTSGLALAAPIINNNDVVKPYSLAYDVDGVEMWTIPPAQRTETLENFTQKCLTEIPDLFRIRIQTLGMSPEDFKYSTKILSKSYRSGTQYICRTSVELLNKKNMFKFDYSKIYKENPYETCKNIVRDMDTRVSELNLFDRRVYFEITPISSSEVRYDKCQVLAIKLGCAKENDLDCKI